MSDVNQSIATLIADAVADEVVAKIFAKLPEMMPVKSRLFTQQEAAEYLRCEVQYFRILARRWKIEPVEWSDGPKPKPYYDVRDLDAAIERAKRKGAE
jgi:hypothetical protein